MKGLITRRDFLKLAGLLPLSIAAPKVAKNLAPGQQTGNLQNVIIIVFDAFSAKHISLHGYQRETTPNLARLAERAVVYHNHYSGGNFTMPGTASLLTGTFPWKHRAFGLGKSTVEKSFVEKNIFSAFQNHYRLAYTHNPVANRLLTQFSNNIDEHIPLGKLFLTNDNFIESLFWRDEDTATVSWVRAMKRQEEGYAYSLFLSHVLEAFRERRVANLRSQFPDGLPHIASDNYFLLEDAIDWLGDTLSSLPQPFMGYFHFMPPHRPYNTHMDFYGQFAGDDYLPVFKPQDLFTSQQDTNPNFLLKRRKNYDEFILYVDREFGKLMDRLEEAGTLENTWVILTSDHGEMFERGILGHITPVLYQPVIRVPLLIFEPGRKTRTDIYSNTSAIDVLPTLLHITGQQSAKWSEGIVLPPFASSESELERDLYVVQAKENAQFAPLTVATIALVKGRYKLMYFFGYEELGANGERIELYDIENDPEEMNDLYSKEKEIAAELFGEMKAKIAEVNNPYQ